MLNTLSTINTESILIFLLQLVVLFFSIILHEMAHGYAALWCGDTTAKNHGRLTLNPLAHVDPFGTLVLPLILLFASGGAFAFGYAKPVPINPYNFRNQQRDLLITGAAGPATNIILAIFGGIIFRLFVLTGIIQSTVIIQTIFYLVIVNLVLAFFNLIPIPPLDGSRIVQRFLTPKMRHYYHKLEPYGFMIVIGITWLLPQVFSAYINFTVGPVSTLLLGI